MKWFRLLEVGLVFIIIGGVYFSGLDAVPFHGDESHWIATSCYLEALLTRDFTEPTWLRESGLDEDFSTPDWLSPALSPALSSSHVWNVHYWTMTQPPVSRYMIALGRLAGGYHVADLNQPWDFQATNTQNVASGAYPARGLLWSSRALMALLSVVSGMILYVLVRHAGGAVSGYVFVVLYVGSEYLLIHLRRAMSEPPLLFFTTLTLLAGVRALMVASRRGMSIAQRFRAALPWLLLMGVGVGLSGAAKLNGLALILVVVALCCIIAWRGQGTRRLWFALGGVVFIGLLAALVFIVVNPFLYPQPILRTLAMGLFRRWEMSHQIRNPVWHIADWGERLNIVPRRILRDYMVLHFGLLNGVLWGVGLYCLARSARWWLLGKGGSAASVALVIVAAVAALPPLFTPLDWDRYYMYPVVFVSLCIAVAVGDISRRVQRVSEW